MGRTLAPDGGKTGSTSYGVDRLRRSLRDTGAIPLIPGRRNQNPTIRNDNDRYHASTSSRMPSTVSKTYAASTPLRQTHCDVL